MPAPVPCAPGAALTDGRPWFAFETRDQVEANISDVKASRGVAHLAATRAKRPDRLQFSAVTRARRSTLRSVQSPLSAPSLAKALPRKDAGAAGEVEGRVRQARTGRRSPAGLAGARAREARR